LQQRGAMPRAPKTPVLSALLLACAVWTLLLLAALARPALGDAAALLGVGAAAALATATRPGLAPNAVRRRAPRLPAGAVGFACGVAARALLGAAAAAAGALLAASSPAPGALRLLCDVALGPALEELVYRERLLPALRAVLGAPLGLALSSLLFALPHGQPHRMGIALAGGLALGAAYMATRSIALCIAAHAGWNLAMWWLAAGAVYGVRP
jgi:membrane protease YdiL (CAAX protease family)